jgi:MoaA/NifB/PqqE/SkfB family radical SAM enzyme
MHNKNIFCNVPWFEVHINADGTYQTCGAQPNPVRVPYPLGWTKKHNVHNMRLEDWINSKYQCNVRLDKLNGVSEPRCKICYVEEMVGTASKRVKENLKSNIDDDDFYVTYQSSPHFSYFDLSKNNQGKTNFLKPISYHLSLGNECNYACKMCGPWASTQLAVEGLRNKTYSGPARLNWTDDDKAWEHVCDYICNTEELKFVHLIGGEPYMTPRFEEFIDRLLAAGRTDIYLGFTTNGSKVDTNLIEKINAFRHVDIGISIECMGTLNDHIRKGTQTNEVLNNIDLYLKYRKESHVYITVRPVPSALSVHTLDELYLWCIDRKVDVMTNILVRPDHLQIQQLPESVKDRLLVKYRQWEFSEPMPGKSDPRDPTRYREHLDYEIKAIIELLHQAADPEQTKKLYDTIQSWGWFDNPNIAKYFKTDHY